MNKYYTIFFFVLFFSCKNTSSTQVKESQQPKMSVVTKHSSVIPLVENSKGKIQNWKEYQAVTDNLNKFSFISAKEALNNALTLNELVRFLKDSIRPKELLTLSFRTRVNVLENETLRLKDMTFLLSAIKADEINQQVEKILAAFSATNSKINAVYNQLEIDEKINLEDQLKY